MNYINGDATKPIGDGDKIIVHICNNLGKWGAGFVLAISKKWSEPRQEYLKLIKYKLGHVQIVQVSDDIYVANMICQNGINGKNKIFKNRVDYDALERCIRKVYKFAKQNNMSIHMPLIGAGLAGGDWNKIENIIEKHISNVNTYVYKFD